MSGDEIQQTEIIASVVDLVPAIFILSWCIITFWFICLGRKSEAHTLHHSESRVDEDVNWLPELNRQRTDSTKDAIFSR